MTTTERVMAISAVAFIAWGLCDVLGVVEYRGKRSTVVTAGTGKMALGLAAILWLGLLI